MLFPLSNRLLLEHSGQGYVNVRIIMYLKSSNTNNYTFWLNSFALLYCKICLHFNNPWVKEYLSLYTGLLVVVRSYITFVMLKKNNLHVYEYNNHTNSSLRCIWTLGACGISRRFSKSFNLHKRMLHQSIRKQFNKHKHAWAFYCKCTRVVTILEANYCWCHQHNKCISEYSVSHINSAWPVP